MKFYHCHPAKAACYGLALFALLAPAGARATAFIYQFSTVFEGTAPEGPPPWITASFSDVSSGVVQMTISAAGMTSAESLGKLLLNLDPADNPTKLKFTYVSSTGSFTQPTITTGENKFKADGDGKYDVDLAFSLKAGKIFTAGDSVTFNISSSGTVLNALDFDALSVASAGGGGPFLAAANFDCTSTKASEWVAPCQLSPVPEPATISLLTSGAALCGAMAWLRRRRNGPAN